MTKEKMQNKPLSNKHKIYLIFTMVAICLLRNCITLFNPTNDWLESIDSFPKLSGFTSTNIGVIIFLKTLGIDSSSKLIIVNGIFAVTLLLISLVKFSKLSEKKAILYGTLLITSPIATLLLSSFGTTDVYLYIGWIILLGTDKKYLVLIGVMITSTAHPYQALAGSIGLYFISIVINRKDLKSKSRLVFISSTFILLLIQCWVYISETTSTRERLFTEYFAQSIVNFFTNFPNSIFSYLGPIWLIIILQFSYYTGLKNKILYITTLTLPMIIAMSTADGTRVFIGIVFPSALTLVIDFVNINVNLLNKGVYFRILIVAFLIYPVTFQITSFMYIPWQGLQNNLEPFVLWWTSL